jgi:ATP-binding protein involved in chromosome partitioning
MRGDRQSWWSLRLALARAILHDGFWTPVNCARWDGYTAARLFSQSPCGPMDDLDRAAIEAAITDYVDPELDARLLESGSLKDLRIDGRGATARIELGFPCASRRERFEAALQARMESSGATPAHVQIETLIQSHAVQRNLKPVNNIKNIVAVASGKGGVGKSTVAVNLALALSQEGARVGLLDADIYGPSQPRMLGLSGQRPASRDGKSLEPLQAYGVEAMSIGFLIDEEQPMIWRGPMVVNTLTQIMRDTRWGALDYLIVDMPPGTGDTQLHVSQHIPVSGVVIVTTPQDIALLDARRGLKMFQKVDVTVLGIVENMSTHVCSSCGHEEHIFGEGGGLRMAAQYSVPFLGSLPLDVRIREQADGGRPSVVAEPTGAIAEAYRGIARRTAARLARASKDYSRLFPKIVIEET